MATREGVGCPRLHPSTDFGLKVFWKKFPQKGLVWVIPAAVWRLIVHPLVIWVLRVRVLLPRWCRWERLRGGF